MLELVSQAPPDNTWQAQAKNGFDLSSFKIDWETKSVQCPMGKTSHAWRIRTDGQNQQQLVEVRFHRKECANCQMRQHCTKSKTEPRLLKFRNQHRHEALQTARKNQTDPAFQKRYAKRAGIEGTISLGVCALDLRRSCYIGLAKTHLQHIATAAAINFCRLFNWWNQVPRAQTRVSSWTRFCYTYFNVSSG
ncbi:MAG: transposase [Calothrix sp. MO_167.B42]|nr:transposase [Calothrix sp. MO_167.B42]